MACADFLADADDLLCVQEFVQLLPQDVRNSLTAALDVIDVVVNTEQILSAEASALTDFLVDTIDEELAAVILLLQPIFSIIDDIRDLVLPFSTCPSVGRIVTTIVGPAIGYTISLRSATWRKQMMREGADLGTSIVLDSVLQFLSASDDFRGAVGKGQGALDTLNDIRDCIGAGAAIIEQPASGGV